MDNFRKGDYIARHLPSGEVAYVACVVRMHPTINVKVLTILIPGIASPKLQGRIFFCVKRLQKLKQCFTCYKTDWENELQRIPTW